MQRNQGEKRDSVSRIETQESIDDHDHVDNEIRSTLLWQVISKEVKTLRIEMEEGRKSAEQAAQNNAEPAESADSDSRCSPWTFKVDSCGKNSESQIIVN